MAISFSSTSKSTLRTWRVQAKRFELNAVSVAMIRLGPSYATANQRRWMDPVWRCHATQSVESETWSKHSTHLQRRYGYLEKAFDGNDSHCLA